MAVVLLATLLPWPAAFLNAGWITFMPDLLLGLLVLGYHFTRQQAGQPQRYKLPLWGVVLLLLLALHTGIALVDGRGIGSGGSLLLIVYVLAFRWALLRSPKEHLAHTLIYSFSLIYAIHVLFLWLELVVRLSGGTAIILELFGQATEVTKYKDYNSAVFLWAIGFGRDQITGLNSLLLGSQSASQLAVFAALWFAPFYKVQPRSVSEFRPLWLFVVAAVMVPVTSSMTSILILAGLLIMLIFILPYSRLAGMQLRFLFTVCLIAFSEIALQVLFFRVRGAHDIDTYTEAFSSSVEVFLSLPAELQWLGFGSNIAQAPVSSADFGLAMLLLQVGILYFGLVALMYSWVLLKALILLRRARRRLKVGGPWHFLVLINLMLSLGWGISLVHYTPAVELGGRHLFAFHLAALLVAMGQVRTQTASSKQQRKDSGSSANEVNPALPVA